MGKIILEFDSEEESQEARTALDGSSWKLAMWDLDQELRKIVKYEQFDGRKATEAEIEGAEKLREELSRILDDYNLNLD